MPNATNIPLLIVSAVALLLCIVAVFVLMRRTLESMLTRFEERIIQRLSGQMPRPPKPGPSHLYTETDEHGAIKHRQVIIPGTAMDLISRSDNGRDQR